MKDIFHDRLLASAYDHKYEIAIYKYVTERLDWIIGRIKVPKLLILSGCARRLFSALPVLRNRSPDASSK